MWPCHGGKLQHTETLEDAQVTHDTLESLRGESAASKIKHEALARQSQQSEDALKEAHANALAKVSAEHARRVELWGKQATDTVRRHCLRA